MFGLFRQTFLDISFLGSRLSISLQLIFKLLGIESPIFYHPPNLGYERMLSKDGFGMIPLQLFLLIKGVGSMFIIDGTDGFRCFPLCRIDSRPETGHFLEDCVSIFNLLGLPEVLFLLMVLTIYEVTALSAQMFWQYHVKLTKLLHPLHYLNQCYRHRSVQFFLIFKL